nr:hypothetical protein [Tanacetum cinerariifolium]
MLDKEHESDIIVFFIKVRLKPQRTQKTCDFKVVWRVLVITKYLVKISKKARILELKRRHLNITVLISYTPYPSRKIRRIAMGKHEKEKLYPNFQTYTEVIRGFLRFGSPGDAMNIYEDMKQSPDPPDELPFRILLKGLLPHPLLRNKVKQDFEEIFPDQSIYDPLGEIFGLR